jgi:hypothetical protein
LGWSKKFQSRRDWNFQSRRDWKLPVAPRLEVSSALGLETFPSLDS